MKSNKTLLIALSILLALPFLNSCRRGEKDPFLSLKSRNSRISAVWTLESGYSEKFYSRTTDFIWLDSECEDAKDGVGNPLPQEIKNEKRVFSKTFNFSDALATYNQLLTTTEKTILDENFNAIVSKNEYEDAYSKSQVQINFDYELTIKKNGEYKIYITYNYFDPDVPLYADDGQEIQYGMTYSGTFEYVSNWHWTDNSLGTREGIMLAGFPEPVINIIPVYDFTDITDPQYDYNYVTGIDYDNTTDMIFELEKLMSKEMTLTAFNNQNFYYHNQDNEFEAYLDGGEKIDCVGTYTETNVENNNYYFQFISDGKSVDQ